MPIIQGVSTSENTIIRESAISSGIIFYVDGLKNLYRSNFPLHEPVFQGLSALEILVNRCKIRGLPGQMLLLIPDREEYAPLAKLAEHLGLGVCRFDLTRVQEKPVMLQQQHWGLEDDTGNDTWVGAAFAAAVSEKSWSTAFLMPLTNLLIDTRAVCESLKLHQREAFDVTVATELLCGAGWHIFSADLLNGLMNSHPDLMWARGGLAWAIRKPLYPFKVGSYHCPRIRPALQVDMRLNSWRAAHTIGAAHCKNFAVSEFSYESWLETSDWAAKFCDYAPLVLNVEPANICNATCYGCVYPLMQRQKLMMTPDVFARVLEGWRPGDDCRWVFSGMGEPMLNPFLPKMLTAVSGFNTMLITSLQKLPGDEFPFSALDQIRISTDSLSDDGFLARRPGCSWKNIEAFLNMAKVRKRAEPDRFPDVGVSCLRTDKTDGQMQAFINYWKQVVRPVFRENFFRWPFDQQPEPIQWYQILGEAVYCGARPKTSRVDFKPVRRRPCRHAMLGVTVLSDGRVTICPYDYDGKFAFGDVKSLPLKEIWQSDVARAFRAEHLARQFVEDSACAGCIDWYHPF
ncbi:MAG TPA: SPASM domain-containing protein [Candidatus Rifleibacterium sp.]|nr:SPASM domain-containing protein [Candidatus Rifleibacterium sp.]HPT46134.1 SPASM domain-containing protein [Candidatus Rifleibacterium sp.]